jgi:hypothetical protein
MGFPFQFELGRRMVQEMGSSIEGSRNPTTWTNIAKSVEEIVVELLKVDKIAELF